MKRNATEVPLVRGTQVQLKGKPDWYTLRSECVNQTVPSWWAISPKGWVVPLDTRQIRKTRAYVAPLTTRSKR